MKNKSISPNLFKWSTLESLKCFRIRSELSHTTLAHCHSLHNLSTLYIEKQVKRSKSLQFIWSNVRRREPGFQRTKRHIVKEYYPRYTTIRKNRNWQRPSSQKKKMFCCVRTIFRKHRAKDQQPYHRLSIHDFVLYVASAIRRNGMSCVVSFIHQNQAEQYTGTSNISTKKTEKEELYWYFRKCVTVTHLFRIHFWWCPHFTFLRTFYYCQLSMDVVYLYRMWVNSG